MDSPAAQALPPATLLARLDAWEERTRGLFEGRVADSFDRVMVDTMERFPQPLQAYLDMIEGQRMDVVKHRYADFSELQLYCYRVAGTVGLMTQDVMGLDPAYTTAPWSEQPDPTEAAVALGIANQLTNILRDVGEDRGRGRIYLPADELARFGYAEADLLARRRGPAFDALMRFQIDRARGYYERSFPGIPLLKPEGRFAVEIAAKVYRDILGRIEKMDYNVYARRAVVPAWKKYSITAGALARRKFQS
jgi:phytoene synthase